MSHKPRNKEETIKRINDTFFKHIINKGYNKVNINKVAKEAKISVGTLYHHFPRGKLDIILDYFEKSKDLTLDIEDFKRYDPENISLFFKPFITNVLKNQRKCPGYRIGLHQAVVSDKEMQAAYQKKIIDICIDTTRKLRKSSEVFKHTPEERLIKRFVFIYNIIDAFIHHHIFIMEFFQDDETFINFLSSLIDFTINYFQNK